MTSRELIYEWIDNERRRQDKKWGEQNHDNPIWLAILTEEVGEIAKDVLEEGDAPFFDANEIIQAAAVCVAWLECLERNA